MMAKKTAAKKKSQPAKAAAKAPVKKAPLASKKAAPAKKKTPKKPAAEKPATKPVVVAKGKVTAKTVAKAAAKAPPQKKVAAAKVAAKPAVVKKAAPRRRIAAKKAAASPMGAAAGMPMGAMPGNESVTASVGFVPSPVGVEATTQTGEIIRIKKTPRKIGAIRPDGADEDTVVGFTPANMAPGENYDDLNARDPVGYNLDDPMNVHLIARDDNVFDAVGFGATTQTGKIIKIKKTPRKIGAIHPDGADEDTIVGFTPANVAPGVNYDDLNAGDPVGYNLDDPMNVHKRS